MVISDTFCWRIPKVTGCFIIGFLELFIAVVFNLEIIRYNIYGNADQLSSMCHNDDHNNSNGDNINCPPAVINRSIMYVLSFVCFVCNVTNILQPFSLLHAYNTEVAVILIPQIVSGIVKLMCLFVYIVLAALFIPVKGLILLPVIAFEHYKIRHLLYLYIHLSEKHKVELIVKLRRDADILKTHLLGPPTYEEAVSHNFGTIPVFSNEPQPSTIVSRPSHQINASQVVPNIDSPSRIDDESQVANINAASPPDSTEPFSRPDVETQVTNNNADNTSAPTESSTRRDIDTLTVTVDVENTCVISTEPSSTCVVNVENRAKPSTDVNMSSTSINFESYLSKPDC